MTLAHSRARAGSSPRACGGACKARARLIRFWGETRPRHSEAKGESLEVISQADKVGHYATKADFSRRECGFSLSIRPKMWCVLSCKVPPIVVWGVGWHLASYGAVGRIPLPRQESPMS